MSVATVGKKPPTIKPYDLVRTPSGRTARCEGLNRDGSRKLRDIITGEAFDLRPELLVLLAPSPICKWKSYKL